MSTNSILTDTQRGYLRMNEEQRGQEYSKQQRHYHRKNIRSRVRLALDDLRLLLKAEAEGEDPAVDLERVLEETDAGRVWGLSALLFQWALEHPMLTDRDALAEALSNPEADVSRQVQMDRAAASFDNQVERGVRAVLEFSEFSSVPKEVSNELTVTLGPPVAEMNDEELADLPRRTLDSLFRDGDLDNTEYARAMELKLASDRADTEATNEQRISEAESALEEHGVEAFKPGPNRVTSADLRLLYEQGRITREEFDEYEAARREHLDHGRSEE